MERNTGAQIRHIDIFNRIFNPNDLEVSLQTHAKIIKIKNADNKSLLGVLSGNSVAILLSTNSESDSTLKTMVQANLLEIGQLHEGKSIPEAACNLLGLPVNGMTEGFFSDANIIGGMNTVHIYNGNRNFTSQRDFVDSLGIAFETRGLEVTIEESL